MVPGEKSIAQLSTPTISTTAFSTLFCKGDPLRQLGWNSSSEYYDMSLELSTFIRVARLVL